MTRTLGSIRSVHASGAVIVTACGVYLTFRLDPMREASTRNLVEIQRMRMGVPPHEMIRMDPYAYARVRRAVVDAIVQHRQKMRLPMLVVRPRSTERQLAFRF